MTIRVFLGGTCNGSTWRDELLPLLDINWFNPVVDDWTPECMAEELMQRAKCDYVLYIITSDMTGVYSIAEVVDDSNKRPERTIFCYLPDGFSRGQIKSLEQVARMVHNNGGGTFDSLEKIAEFLNNVD